VLKESGVRWKVWFVVTDFLLGNSSADICVQWSTLETLFRSAGMDINRLSNERQLLTQPESNPNIDQIVAHGVMSNTDIYTYVPNEQLNEELSTQSSASLSRRGSDNSQHASLQRKPSSRKSKAKPTASQSPRSTGPVVMPILTRPDATQMPWTDLSTQYHEIHQGEGMLQQHYMLSGVPPGFIPMNPVPENIQGGNLGFQPQMTGTEYTGAGIGMGTDNMDLDSVTSNLWWDQPFEAIPTEQYGIWYPSGYQSTDGSGYYRP
jgi:hypothetical protein